MSLSKSSVLRGYQCEKSLWLLKNRPKLKPSVSSGLQAVFDQGTEVGLLARDVFPGGVSIDAKERGQIATCDIFLRMKRGQIAMWNLFDTNERN